MRLKFYAAKAAVQWQQGCRFKSFKGCVAAAKAKGTAMAVRVPSASFSLSAVDCVRMWTFYVRIWTLNFEGFCPPINGGTEGGIKTIEVRVGLCI